MIDKQIEATQKPLRVLFTGALGECIPPPYGGIPKRALMLAKQWKTLGHTIGMVFGYHHHQEDDLGAEATYFFEYQQKPNKWHKAIFLARYASINPRIFLTLLRAWTRAEKRLTREALLYSAFGVFFFRLCKQFRPDVIIAETALIRSFMAGHVARRLGIPFILEPYAEIHDRSMVKLRGFSEEERTTYWKNFLALANAIIGASQYCAQGPLTYASKDKVHVIHATTLDVERFQDRITKEEQRAMRQSFGLNPDLFYIIAVGAFTERKGHDHIIEAVSRLRDASSSFGVILCGAGQPDAWKALAHRLGVGDQVFCFQNLSEDDLTKLYKCADLYCDASNTPRACLGIALTEGLASSLPAVVYNAGGLPEVVLHKETGILVPLNDIDGLADAFSVIRSLPENEYERLQQNALIRMRDYFDIRVISSRLLDVLYRTITPHG